MSFSKIIPFVIGLYIGKYHAQYVPLPQINKENFDKILRYLEEATRRTDPPTAPPPQTR
jgi:hypothetical protein